MSSARLALRDWLGGLGQWGQTLGARLARVWRPLAPGPAAGLSPRASNADRFDVALVWVTLCLLALGLVMVYSASVALPENQKFAAQSSAFFLKRQAVYIGVALMAGLVTLQVPIARWRSAAPWLFAGSLLLLILVLLPMIGKDVNGARRWISVAGITFQPSELTKLAICLYAADYMVRKMEVKENFAKAVWPMAAALAVVGTLLLAEPDMGAFMVIAAVALGVLFLGGVNSRMFFLSAAVLVGAFVLMIVFSEFRRERIFAYLDPWDPRFASGKAYQLTHSLIAFGRGGLLGQGLGNSIEKLHYLPEAHTDFLLAVIGEELGFIAVAAVILAFFWLVRRIFQIGRQAVLLDQLFAGLLAQGVGLWIGVQSFINMGVNLGALPTKGLTLPLFSYGGTGVVVNLIALGLVLRVDQENKLRMRGGRA